MNQNNDGELALTDSSRNIDRSVDHNKVYNLSSWTSSSSSNKEISFSPKMKLSTKKRLKTSLLDFSWTDYASNMAILKQNICNCKKMWELGFGDSGETVFVLCKRRAEISLGTILSNGLEIVNSATAEMLDYKVGKFYF